MQSQDDNQSTLNRVDESSQTLVEVRSSGPSGSVSTAPKSKPKRRICNRCPKPLDSRQLPKHFASEYTLQRHISVRHGRSSISQEYRCASCNKTYARLFSLQRHEQQKHSANNPRLRECRYCKNSYIKDYLKKHESTCDKWIPGLRSHPGVETSLPTSAIRSVSKEVDKRPQQVFRFVDAKALPLPDEQTLLLRKVWRAVTHGDLDGLQNTMQLLRQAGMSVAEIDRFAEVTIFKAGASALALGLDEVFFSTAAEEEDFGSRVWLLNHEGLLLHLAALKHNLPIFAYLIEMGFQLSRKSLRPRSSGRDVLDLALLASGGQWGETGSSYLPIIAEIVERWPPPRVDQPRRNRALWESLGWSSCSEDLDIVKRLFAAGAEAQHIFAQEGYTGMCHCAYRLLNRTAVEQGCNVPIPSWVLERSEAECASGSGYKGGIRFFMEDGRYEITVLERDQWW